MIKKLLIVLIIIFMTTLYGCQDEISPEAQSLQTQYENFRLNEFSDTTHFIDYMNHFALDVSRAAVHVTVEYDVIGLENPTYEGIGMIIKEDPQYYYVATNAHLFDDGDRRFRVYVEDIYDVMYTGSRLSIDRDMGIVIIRFTKQSLLTVLSQADALPFNNEMVVILSDLGQIKNQIALGTFVINDTTNAVSIDLPLDEGLIGGGIFDVNHRLVGLVMSEDGQTVITYEDIWSLIQ